MLFEAPRPPRFFLSHAITCSQIHIRRLDRPVHPSSNQTQTHPSTPFHPHDPGQRLTLFVHDCVGGWKERRPKVWKPSVGVNPVQSIQSDTRSWAGVSSASAPDPPLTLTLHPEEEGVAQVVAGARLCGCVCGRSNGEFTSCLPASQPPPHTESVQIESVLTELYSASIIEP